jgi:CheY-like chemotaxis protein
MSTKSALVVDDSKSSRFALRKSLETQGYAVSTAEGAEECYKQLALATPDMIFLDHVMPGIDGFDALRHLRADRNTMNIPIIICSSHDTPEFLAEARGLGATDVLVKPPSAEQLGAILERIERDNAPTQAEAPSARVAPVGQRVIAAIRSTLNPVVKPERREASSDIGAQLAELRQQAAQLEEKLAQEQRSTEVTSSAGSRELQQTLQEFQRRLDSLEAKVDAKLANMQAALDTGLLMQSERLLRVTEASRVAAVENAHAEAERTVLKAASSISEQLINSLVASLRSGSFKPLLSSSPEKSSPSETVTRLKA